MLAVCALYLTGLPVTCVDCVGNSWFTDVSLWLLLQASTKWSESMELELSYAKALLKTWIINIETGTALPEARYLLNFDTYYPNMRHRLTGVCGRDIISNMLRSVKQKAFNGRAEDSRDFVEWARAAVATYLFQGSQLTSRGREWISRNHVAPEAIRACYDSWDKRRTLQEYGVDVSIDIVHIISAVVVETRLLVQRDTYLRCYCIGLLNGVQRLWGVDCVVSCFAKKADCFFCHDGVPSTCDTTLSGFRARLRELPLRVFADWSDDDYAAEIAKLRDVIGTVSDPLENETRWCDLRPGDEVLYVDGAETTVLFRKVSSIPGVRTLNVRSDSSATANQYLLGAFPNALVGVRVLTKHPRVKGVVVEDASAPDGVRACLTPYGDFEWPFSGTADEGMAHIAFLTALVVSCLHPVDYDHIRQFYAKGCYILSYALHRPGYIFCGYNTSIYDMSETQRHLGQLYATPFYQIMTHLTSLMLQSAPRDRIQAVRRWTDTECWTRLFILSTVLGQTPQAVKAVRSVGVLYGDLCIVAGVPMLMRGSDPADADRVDTQHIEIMRRVDVVGPLLEDASSEPYSVRIALECCLFWSNYDTYHRGPIHHGDLRDLYRIPLNLGTGVTMTWLFSYGVYYTGTPVPGPLDILRPEGAPHGIRAAFKSILEDFARTPTQPLTSYKAFQRGNHANHFNRGGGLRVDVVLSKAPRALNRVRHTQTRTEPVAQATAQDGEEDATQGAVASDGSPPTIDATDAAIKAWYPNWANHAIGGYIIQGNKDTIRTIGSATSKVHVINHLFGCLDSRAPTYTPAMNYIVEGRTGWRLEPAREKRCVQAVNPTMSYIAGVVRMVEEQLLTNCKVRGPFQDLYPAYLTDHDAGRKPRDVLRTLSQTVNKALRTRVGVHITFDGKNMQSNITGVIGRTVAGLLLSKYRGPMRAADHPGYIVSCLLHNATRGLENVESIVNGAYEMLSATEVEQLNAFLVDQYTKVFNGTLLLHFSPTILSGIGRPILMRGTGLVAGQFLASGFVGTTAMNTLTTTMVYGNFGTRPEGLTRTVGSVSGDDGVAFYDMARPWSLWTNAPTTTRVNRAAVPKQYIGCEGDYSRLWAELKRIKGVFMGTADSMGVTAANKTMVNVICSLFLRCLFQGCLILPPSGTAARGWTSEDAPGLLTIPEEAAKLTALRENYARNARHWIGLIHRIRYRIKIYGTFSATAQEATFLRAEYNSEVDLPNHLLACLTDGCTCTKKRVNVHTNHNITMTVYPDYLYVMSFGDAILRDLYYRYGWMTGLARYLDLISVEVERERPIRKQAVTEVFDSVDADFTAIYPPFDVEWRVSDVTGERPRCVGSADFTNIHNHGPITRAFEAYDIEGQLHIRDAITGVYYTRTHIEPIVVEGGLPDALPDMRIRRYRLDDGIKQLKRLDVHFPGNPYFSQCALYERLAKAIQLETQESYGLCREDKDTLCAIVDYVSKHNTPMSLSNIVLEDEIGPIIRNSYTHALCRVFKRWLLTIRGVDVRDFTTGQRDWAKVVEPTALERALAVRVKHPRGCVLGFATGPSATQTMIVGGFGIADGAPCFSWCASGSLGQLLTYGRRVGHVNYESTVDSLLTLIVRWVKGEGVLTTKVSYSLARAVSKVTCARLSHMNVNVDSDEVEQYTLRCLEQLGIDQRRVGNFTYAASIKHLLAAEMWNVDSTQLETPTALGGGAGAVSFIKPLSESEIAMDVSTINSRKERYRGKLRVPNVLKSFSQCRDAQGQSSVSGFEVLNYPCEAHGIGPDKPTVYHIL